MASTTPSSVTYPVTVVRDNRLPTVKESPMTQLRIASVNLRVVSRRTKLSSDTYTKSRVSSLPPLAQKAARLHAINPGAAAVIEKLVDDLLSQIA